MTNSDTPVTVPGYRGLVALVIGLGVLMGLALVALVVGAIVRMSGAGLSTGAPFQTALPAAGQQVESVQLDGNRILVRLTGGEAEQLVVLDATTGRVVGRVVVDAGQ